MTPERIMELVEMAHSLRRETAQAADAMNELIAELYEKPFEVRRAALGDALGACQKERCYGADCPSPCYEYNNGVDNCVDAVKRLLDALGDQV